MQRHRVGDAGAEGVWPRRAATARARREEQDSGSIRRECRPNTNAKWTMPALRRSHDGRIASVRRQKVHVPAM